MKTRRAIYLGALALALAAYTLIAWSLHRSATAPQAAPAALACGGCIVDDPPPPPPAYWPPRLLFFPLVRSGSAGETGEAVGWTPTPTPKEEIGPPAQWSPTPTPAALALASATPTRRPPRCSVYAPASWSAPGCTHPAEDPEGYATDVAGREYAATAYPRPPGGRSFTPAVMPTRHPYAGAARRPTPTPRR